MKKIIAITLAVLMAAMTFIFAGCGDKRARERGAGVRGSGQRQDARTHV